MGQELYELPERWEWRPLGEITEFKNGFAFKSKDFSSSGLPILRISNIQSGGISFERTAYLPEYLLDDKISKCFVEKNDVVIAMSGATTGKVAINNSGQRLLQNQRVGRFLIPDDTLRKYVYLFLSAKVSDNLQKSLGAAQPNLSTAQIKEIQIPLPPLNEQKRIVAKLDALFTRIDTAIIHLQQTLELSKALFASALDEVMQSNLESWEKTMIREVSTKVSTGPFGSMLHKSDYISNGIPLVNPVNIIKGKIVPDHKKNVTEEMKSRLQSYVISAGDIVLARRGEIGRCAVVTDSESGWICGTGCFFLTPKRNVNPGFLANLIRSSTYKKNLEDVATGATIKNISNRLLSDFSFSLPSLDEQNRIVAHLDALSERTRTLEATTQEKINDLTALKASLFDSAFKGQL